MSSPAPVASEPADPAGGVSVVVPARDAADGLRAAVSSALVDPEVDEVVIAVGPSRDDTEGVATELANDPRVRIVANPHGTTSHGLNRAIAATHGDVIVRVDAHAELPPGYVTRAVATLQRTGAANVGGQQVPTATRGFARAVAAAMRSPAGSGGAAYRSAGTEGPVDTVYLGVFRRDALEDVGGFAPEMVRNQDAELNARLRSAGHVVWFDPELAVTYRPRASVGALARQYLEYGRWRRVTAGRHRDSLRPRQLAAPAIVVTLGLAVVAGVVRRAPRVPAVVGGSYLAAATVAGVVGSQEPRDAPATTVALVTMHLAWGIGFLLGPPRRTDEPGGAAVGPDASDVSGRPTAAGGPDGERSRA